MDKINNIEQKENKLLEAGVTRLKCFRVIAEALEAEIMGEVIDEQGNVIRKMIPHVLRQQWGAEQAARLFSDFTEHKTIEQTTAIAVTVRHESIQERRNCLDLN